MLQFVVQKSSEQIKNERTNRRIYVKRATELSRQCTIPSIEFIDLIAIALWY